MSDEWLFTFYASSYKIKTHLYLVLYVRNMLLIIVHHLGKFIYAAFNLFSFFIASGKFVFLFLTHCNKFMLCFTIIVEGLTAAQCYFCICFVDVCQHTELISDVRGNRHYFLRCYSYSSQPLLIAARVGPTHWYACLCRLILLTKPDCLSHLGEVTCF